MSVARRTHDRRCEESASSRCRCSCEGRRHGIRVVAAGSYEERPVEAVEVRP